MTTAQLVLDCRNHHGEGIFWNAEDGLVWWTDIEGRALWRYDPASGTGDRIDLADRVCCFAPRRAGGLIVAFAGAIALMDPATGETEEIHKFEPDNPHTRTNDGRTDRQGRFVVGGMNEGTGDPDSSVICVDTDLSVKTLIRGVSCANSTCFTADGRTMFFADTPQREIWAYDYDPTDATLSNRRTLTSFSQEPGLPDGSCTDAEGGVWNAEWNGRRVVRIAPDGGIDTVIDVPVLNPTCCAFGGPDLDTLYITTSRLLMSDDEVRAEPGTGGLFAVKPGVTGVRDAPFNG